MYSSFYLQEGRCGHVPYLDAVVCARDGEECGLGRIGEARDGCRREGEKADVVDLVVGPGRHDLPDLERSNWAG